MNTLYQLALFQSVAQGEYYGASTVAEFKEHGDFGMGIFEAVDGELIMLNGVVYQAPTSPKPVDVPCALI